MVHGRQNCTKKTLCRLLTVPHHHQTYNSILEYITYNTIGTIQKVYCFVHFFFTANAKVNGDHANLAHIRSMKWKWDSIRTGRECWVDLTRPWGPRQCIELTAVRRQSNGNKGEIHRRPDIVWTLTMWPVLWRSVSDRRLIAAENFNEQFLFCSSQHFDSLNFISQ